MLRNSENLGLRERPGDEGAAGGQGLEGGGALAETPDFPEGAGQAAALGPGLGAQREDQNDPGLQPLPHI